MTACAPLCAAYGLAYPIVISYRYTPIVYAIVCHCIPFSDSCKPCVDLHESPSVSTFFFAKPVLLQQFTRQCCTNAIPHIVA